MRRKTTPLSNDPKKQIDQPRKGLVDFLFTGKMGLLQGIHFAAGPECVMGYQGRTTAVREKAKSSTTAPSAREMSSRAEQP